MKFLYAFGLNEDGQCGVNSTKREKIFFPLLVRFPMFVDIVSISAGSRHTIALSSDGAVYTWGWGHVGQLGHGDCNNSPQPVRVANLKATSISAGGMHSACITSSNNLYTWGSNTYGQLGLGKAYYNKVVCVPTLVQLDEEDCDDNSCDFLCKQVSCGGMHTAAIGLAGDLYSWGKADSGQTGTPTWYLNFSPCVYSPKFVEGPSDRLKDVSCGGFFTLCATEKGAVYAMGKEDYGCLGAIPDLANMSIGMETPTLVTALLGQRIKSLCGAGWHSCFLSDQGDLFTVGKGEYGRLGLGDEKSRTTPVKVDQNVVAVSGGGSHTIYLTKNNEIFSVGRLDGGRCGVGPVTTDRLKTPQNITSNFVPMDGFQILEIAAGGSHTLVLIDYPGVNLENVATFFSSYDTFRAERFK